MYDIIGDVHGYLKQLEMLLAKMGYELIDGVWQHKTRKAIFIGDFINRGPNSKGVIALVRKMVKNGSGFAIIGNHELNAICYFTLTANGYPLRKPSVTSIEELEKVREEYRDKDGIINQKALNRDIKWMRKLPFFIEFEGFRVAHAYWDNHAIALAQSLYEDGKIKKHSLRKIIDKHTPESKAVQQLTRGIELELPHDFSIKCNKGIKRLSFRVKWWQSLEGKTFRESNFGNKFYLPELTIPKEFFDSHSPYFIEPYAIYNDSNPLLIVGHYCIGSGDVQFPAKNVCCVDSCVASGGVLSAYRYDIGDKEFDMAKLIWV